VPTRQQRPWCLLALGRVLPGVMAAAACLGQQNLQAADIPGPDFLQGPQGVQFCWTAAHLGEPSQQVERVLGPEPHTGFRELSSVALLLGELSLLACAFCYPWSNGTMGPAYTGVWVFLAFHCEGRRPCIGGSMEILVLVCTRPWDLPLSNGAWSCMMTLRAGDGEC
jgi:hypothetical protein